jgi:hypothetical protein
VGAGARNVQIVLLRLTGQFETTISTIICVEHGLQSGCRPPRIRSAYRRGKRNLPRMTLVVPGIHRRQSRRCPPDPHRFSRIPPAMINSPRPCKSEIRTASEVDRYMVEQSRRGLEFDRAIWDKMDTASVPHSCSLHRRTGQALESRPRLLCPVRTRHSKLDLTVVKHRVRDVFTESSAADLQCLVNGDLLNKSSFAGS